jgi:hypothetical protein
VLRYKLPLVKADNDRKNGWARCHELLRLAPDGRPWVTLDARCLYLRRSLCGLQSAPYDLDDADSKGDDHGADAFRYGCQSRFVTRRTRRGARVLKPYSYGWMKAQSTRPAGLLAKRGAA